MPTDEARQASAAYARMLATPSTDEAGQYIRDRARAAAIASCPGYEMSPNPCRCPCYGCRHHCSAHNPDYVEEEEGEEG